VTYRKWRGEIAQTVGDRLLDRARAYRSSDPSKAKWIYGRIVEQGGWLPLGVRAEAAWQLWTGMGIGVLLWVLAIATAFAVVVFLSVRRFQRTYRSTFEALHAKDRAAAAL
jgi:hypothetical protein